jgi:hypothetical protein
MAKRARPRRDRELEIKKLQFKQQQHLADNITKIIQDIVKWGFLFGIFYLGYLSIVELAGKITVADLKVAARGLFDFGGGTSTIGLWIGLLGLCFGWAGIRYGHRQARLKGEAIERMHEYQQKYEQSIDPRRTSSRLTSKGDTRPEDQ